jgi:hypothetical protein
MTRLSVSLLLFTRVLSLSIRYDFLLLETIFELSITKINIISTFSIILILNSNISCPHNAL